MILGAAVMKIIAIANQKGGTGKSATTHALGAVLASELQRRVLMVDTDPQSSLTEASGVGDAEGISLAEVLGGATPGKTKLQDILSNVSEYQSSLMHGIDKALKLSEKLADMKG